MILKLAFRNVIHDRVRCAIVTAGSAVSLALVCVQLGVLAGFDRMISATIDHANADLWVVPPGSTTFDDAGTLDAMERYAALSVDGVADVTPVVVAFAEWRKPHGGTSTVVLVGGNPSRRVLTPWDVVAGGVNDLAQPDAVAIDKTYCAELDACKIDDVARIEGRSAKVKAMTEGIRSFTTTPYVFTTAAHARDFLGLGDDRATFLAVSVRSGADLDGVAAALTQKLRHVEVLTNDELRTRNLMKWLSETGAGAVLIGGTVLSLIVGSIIVAQALYASVKDHMREYATLRAMGSSKRYLKHLVYGQSAFCAVLGLAVATSLVAIVIQAGALVGVPIIISARLAATVAILAIVMSVVASFGSVRRVLRVDPTVVFAA